MGCPAYAQFDRSEVDTIAKAAAEAAFRESWPAGRAAVRETSFGVAADKKIKNEITSRGMYRALSHSRLLLEARAG